MDETIREQIDRLWPKLKAGIEYLGRPMTDADRSERNEPYLSGGEGKGQGPQETQTPGVGRASRPPGDTTSSGGRRNRSMELSHRLITHIGHYATTFEVLGDGSMTISERNGATMYLTPEERLALTAFLLHVRHQAEDEGR